MVLIETVEVDDEDPSNPIWMSFPFPLLDLLRVVIDVLVVMEICGKAER